MGHFTAELDEMQAVIDGRLADALDHFTRVSASVDTLSQDPPSAAIGPDPGGIGQGYARTMTTMFTTYAEDLRQLVAAVTYLRNGLQHVVDVYRKAEGDSAQGLRAAG